LLVQTLLAALAVPTQVPLLLHVSGLVQSLLSLHDVPGEQLPAHAPLTQAIPEHGLHAPLAPPPHIAVVSLATATQVLPLQQPPEHEAAVQTHTPPLHAVPLPQIFATGAGQPEAGTHAPTVWHVSGAVQATAEPPPQTPAEQVSPVLHILPVLHDPELLATAAGHPVAGTQAATVWH
jgi:hypothetical protein